MGDYAGRSFLQRTLPMLFKESDFTKAYLSVFSDSDGKLGILSSCFNPPIYSQILHSYSYISRKSYTIIKNDERGTCTLVEDVAGD